MAVTCLSADQLSQHDFLQDAELDGSEFVSKHKRKTIFFFDPAGASWMVGDLEDTIYSGKENVVNGWNKFYLPDIVNMQVMGVVKGTSCLCDQLVLMTCEDRKLYAYDGDELHLVASSLKQLILLGMEYPAAKSYHKGEAFRNMTDKDWDQVRRYDVGKCLDKEHHELVMTNDSHFLKNLSSIRPTTGDKRARMATVACLPTNQIIRASVRDEELEGSEFVSKHKSKIYPLKSPAGATWTVGDLEDTIYSGKENVVNGWNKFYLPDIVNMQVMGVVEGTSCECDQLVLMTCEDGQLYAYDGDELHLVASSLKQLIDDGMEYPAAKSYDKGEAFENTTDKDWDEVRGGDVGKRLDKEHHELVMAKV